MYNSRWAPPPTPPAAKTQTAAENHAPPTVEPPAAIMAAPETTHATIPAPLPLPVEAEAPPPDISTLDSFAQTGANQDDLFDDLEPTEESMRLRSEEDLFSEDFTPAPAPEVVLDQQEQHSTPQANDHTFSKTQTHRGARGGARGNRGRGGKADAPQHHQPASHDNRNLASTTSGTTIPASDKPIVTTAPDNAPIGPRKEVVGAVRGDRQATGGVRKPKLTEAELAEKMARIQIKNANLTAAHARAEADAASFAERETQARQLAEQRRKEERRDRQQLLGEREKNRMRKLKAAGGREWDMEKDEQDFAKGGARADKKGAFAGDKPDYSDGREYLLRDAPQRSSPAARTASSQQRHAAALANGPDDFPALPATGAAKRGTKPAGTQNGTAMTESDKLPTRSWAEQMETPVQS